jgi:hypothetical protein
MEEAELKQKFEQVNEIKEVLGSYFEKEELEVGMVVSVLMSMLVTIMKEADTPPHHAIMLFGTAICKSYEDNEDKTDEEGVAKWVN